MSTKDYNYNRKRPTLPGRCDSVEQRDAFKQFANDNSIKLCDLIDLAIANYLLLNTIVKNSMKK